MTIEKKLKKIHKQIEACRACPRMCGTPVHGPAIETPVMLMGQAPGVHESKFDKPFAYTAGKTLFSWFQSIGLDEEHFRQNVYISAVARCYPGKSGKGDREPDKEEISNCSVHVREEVKALKPKLVIAVGRLAITQVLGEKQFPKSKTLADVVGKKMTSHFYGEEVEVICLPHPSGVSRWPRTEEGAKKLKAALALLKKHPDWQGITA